MVRPYAGMRDLQADFETCLFCRETVMKHEPIVVVEHHGERETTLAHEPDLAARVRGLLVHRRCAPPGWPQQR